MDPMRRLFLGLASFLILAVAFARPATADEIWVAPTSQQDFGGIGVASNGFWPVTVVGAVRLAWAVPGNLLSFQNARLVLIPNAPGGAGTLNFFVCAAENGQPAAGACSGPHAVPFVGVANQLVEVDISAAIATKVGVAGANHLAVLAYTTPTTLTDRILGLRFAFAPVVPPDAATLGSNTFTGTLTAPAFVGDGAGIANVNAALLDGIDSTGFAAAAHGHHVSQIANAATLGANMFTGTQSVVGGNLSLENSTVTTGLVTKVGVRFLHNFGPNNTYLGSQAGSFTSTGSSNVGIGSAAMRSNIGGFGNTATGVSALAENLDGSRNTATGASALMNNDFGNGNTAIGESALAFNITGSNNTALGSGALVNNTTGVGNIAIGVNAGSILSTGSNNIYLGANAAGAAAEANTMYLGRIGTQTRAFIAGVRGVTTTLANAIPVVIDSAGQLGTVSSSRRYKEDIRDMGEASRRLLALRPVTFRYRQSFGDGSKPIQYGLIAEEVAAVFPDLAVVNVDGEPETVQYQHLSVLLLNELQKQHRRVEALEQQVKELAERLSRER